MRKFKETGSVVNRKHNSRKQTVLNEDMLQDVSVSFERSTKKSLRKSAFKAIKLHWS